MPVDWSKYPPDWQEIRKRIQARSGGRCEWCGAVNYEPHPVTGSKVVLTVMHLDHDTTHNDDSNLLHACQKCHNGHDAPFRAANRRARRVQAIEAAGQGRLFEET